MNGRSKKVTKQVIYYHGQKNYGKPIIVNKFYEGKVSYQGLDNYRSTLVDIGAISTSLVRLCDSNRNSKKYGIHTRFTDGKYIIRYSYNGYFFEFYMHQLSKESVNLLYIRHGYENLPKTEEDVHVNKVISTSNTGFANLESSLEVFSKMARVSHVLLKLFRELVIPFVCSSFECLAPNSTLDSIAVTYTGESALMDDGW